MSNILVVAEHLDGELKKASAQTVGFAKDVKAITGGEIIGLVMGSGAQSRLSGAYEQIEGSISKAYTNRLL